MRTGLLLVHLAITNNWYAVTAIKLRDIYPITGVFFGRFKVEFGDPERFSSLSELMEVIGDRTNKWSADHCCDPALVPGVILSNKTEWKQGPCGSWDLAPSILASFGLPVPPEMDGTPILKA